MNTSSLFTNPRRRWYSLLVLTALTCGGLTAASGVSPRGSAGTPGVAQLQAMSRSFADVTKKAAPAVVFIQVEKKVVPVASQPNLPEGFDDDIMKRFFGDRFKHFDSPKFNAPEPFRTRGQGSGFIISKDGYILTNNHVVGDADNVHVTLADGREFEAEIVGTDPKSDVAVIRIDANQLPTLAMGNSDALEVGDWVLAVGSPFGLSGTVTSGIVSAKGRSSVGITDYENFIQTDAAINPGNSGGPLLNLEGEVVGINTAIASRTGVYNGIGFAIPIDMAREICHQLIDDGSVTRGYLGVAIQPLSNELAKSFGLDTTSGVLISDVSQGSPADHAGLKHGDVIVEYDGYEVDQIGKFRNRVAATKPNDIIKVTVWRDGERHTLDVTLGELPGEASLAGGRKHSTNQLGLTTVPLTDDLAAKQGYVNESGVVIAEVESGSVAARAGLRSGMLIKEVNRQPVHDADSFRAAIKDAMDGETVLLHVRDGKHSRYVALRLNR